MGASHGTTKINQARTRKEIVTYVTASTRKTGTSTRYAIAVLQSFVLHLGWLPDVRLQGK